MNKVNKRSIRILKKNANLMVVLFLLAGVFLLSGCGNESGEVLFRSENGENGLAEGDTSQKQEAVSQESGFYAAQENQVETEFGEKNSTEGNLSGSDLASTDLEESNAGSKICYVYVCGAIASPGVYEVEPDTRICEVIKFAGGLTAEAETTCINQALAVYDGLMLNVPTIAQWESGEFILDENGFPVQVQKTEQKAGENQEPSIDDGKVDINKATVEQLCTLPGVGVSRAESIVAYREEHGAFEKIEDIKNVTGIKDGLFEKIKEKIKV